MSAMSAGRTRQHPPTMHAPSAIHCGTSSDREPRSTHPGASLRVPAFAAVGIDDHRLAGGFACDGDSRQHIGRCAAVDADRDDLSHPGGNRERVRQGLTGAGVPPVDGVAEPGRHTELLDKRHQRLGLVDIGDRFQRQHVGPGVGQDFQPWPVPLCQRRDGQAVATAVFRPVGQRRAVGTDRRGNPASIATYLVTRRSGQFDAAAQQASGLPAVDAPGRETVERGLIARRGGEHRSGAKERDVNGHNLVGCVNEQPRRPERIREIVAAGLQFGGQAAVTDQHGIVGQCEYHGVTLRPVVRAASRSDNGGDTPRTQSCVPGGDGGVRRYVLRTDKYHRRDSALSVAPRRNKRVASGLHPR